MESIQYLRREKEIKTKKYISPLVLVSLLVIFSFSTINQSCSAPSYRGWSGARPVGDVIYIATQDSRVLALSEKARRENLPSPAEGEWSFSPKPVSSRNILSCAPPPPMAIYGTPVINNNLVYVATFQGRIYALNAGTGAVRWVYPREGEEVTGQIVGDLLVSGGKVFVPTSSGLYALDSETGDYIWLKKVEAKIWTAAVSKNNSIVFGSHDGYLRAVSSEKGDEQWIYKASSAISSPPSVADNRFIIGTFDRQLVCIEEGQEKWKASGGNWYWAKPLVIKDLVFAPCLDGILYIYKLDSGEIVKNIDLGSPIVSAAASSGSYVVAVSENGRISCLDINTIEIIKSAELDVSVIAPLYAKDNNVYLHSRNRNLLSVKIPGCEVTWKYPLTLK